MNVHERLGLAIMAYEQEVLNHRRTIAILKSLVAGDLDASRLTVRDDGWTLAPAQLLEIVGEIPAGTVEN